MTERTNWNELRDRRLDEPGAREARPGGYKEFGKACPICQVPLRTHS